MRLEPFRPHDFQRSEHDRLWYCSKCSQNQASADENCPREPRWAIPAHYDKDKVWHPLKFFRSQDPVFQITAEQERRDLVDNGFDTPELVVGKWYFWLETWVEIMGPFDTELFAREGLDKYCQEELGLERRVCDDERTDSA